MQQLKTRTSGATVIQTGTNPYVPSKEMTKTWMFYACAYFLPIIGSLILLNCPSVG